MKLFSLIILISSIFAQSPFDWQDNGVPLRQGTHIEWWKATEVGNEGELIIVWSDCRYGIRDIFAQKITIDGELLWGTDGELVALEDGLKDGITVAQAEGRQEDPIIITDGQGGFYMMWMDYRNEPAKGDIYAQHVFSDGSLQFGLEGTPLSNLPGKQSSPNMCKDNLGGVFAIWKDESDGSAILKGTHISYDGDILAPGEGLIINNSTHSKSSASLEVIGDGLAGLTWSRTIPVGAGEEENSDIYIQIIDVDLNTQLSTTEEGGVVICDSPFKQTSAKVTYLNGEQFVVTWQDHRTPENFGDIYMQYFDLEGNALLENNGMPISTTDGEQKRPRVKGDDSGAYLVWLDYRNSSDAESPDIYIQKVSLDGTVLLTSDGERLTAFDLANQINPRLSVDGMGGAYFIWEDYRNGAYPEVDIYIQHLNANNELSFETNGLQVNAENSISPVLKSDGYGGVFAAWDDYRIGSNSIYLQRITPETGIHYEDNGMEVFSGITGNVGDPDTDIHANSVYIEDGKTLVYWIDNRWAPTYQEVTFGMIIDNNYNESINWTNGVELSLNPSQGDPKVAYRNNNFLMTYLVEGENTAIYYLSLDSELNFVGDGLGTPLLEGADWSMNNPKLISGMDNAFYLAYSGQKYGVSSIFLQKFDENGNPQWDENGIDISENTGILMDHVLVDIVESPNGGVIISWIEQSWFTGYQLFMKGVDSEGNTIEGWGDLGVNIVTEGSTKNNPKTFIASDKIFCTWEDERNSGLSTDLYGQLISLNGEILGDEAGFQIVSEIGNQTSISSVYNSATNEVYNCWQDYRDSENYNIYCNSLDIETFETSNEIIISDDIGDQISPSVVLGNSNSYLVVWEDERNTPPAPEGEFVALEKDVYFQQVVEHAPVFEGNGYPLCNELYKQSKPIIFPQSPEQDAFYMVWMDLRSTGKEDLKNIYAQAITLDNTVESISENSQLPNEFKINSIYPNPFNPSTTISFQIPEMALIKVEIVNLLGQTVEVLYNDIIEAGSHNIEWNPSQIVSGSYFVRLNYDGESSQIQKVMYIK